MDNSSWVAKTFLVQTQEGARSTLDPAPARSIDLVTTDAAGMETQLGQSRNATAAWAQGLVHQIQDLETRLDPSRRARRRFQVPFSSEVLGFTIWLFQCMMPSKNVIGTCWRRTTG